MSHYFETPTGPENRRELTLRFWDEEWAFTTADGVFSGSRLDPGTAVLLRESTPAPESRRILDLGCGYGVLAVALAVACPQAIVDAVDVNSRALELATSNAEVHGVSERVHALLPDHVDPQARYDEIWSNPPIRIGKAALHELLLTWLPRLSPNGVARLVVSKNLGADSLQSWLIAQGFTCERYASAKGFRLFRVTQN